MTYVGTEYKNGEYIMCLIRDFGNPETDLVATHGATKPTKNADGTYDDFAMEEWKMEHRMFLD